ncbi:transcriptional regulator [Pedobacter sp. HMF7647]|uniref:Transcriptional regulator n=1 Tax=Hufsiella arboris TaxID=2695275 RepID=A0A7K1Y6D7_9SPHI|nr:winged helix-turn-helix domain-containing protein [Hufsiella arboris]MXV50137.1 transcriptional regulator [Hufsiella arboris]
MRTKYSLGLICLLCISLFCVAFSWQKNNDFELAKREILFREIRHKILLQARDSTSRVLPVRKLATNEYQIRFENEFSFQPASLVQIIDSELAKDNLSDKYIVNVLKCSGNDIIFGYAMLGNKSENIVPCAGREQAKNCYLVNIKFENDGITSSQKGYLIGSLPLLAFIGLIVTRSVKTRKNKTHVAESEFDGIYIGNILFEPGKRQITAAGIRTSLTVKENKLLLILANPVDTIVERNRLQKEIWEDEGVIVGRSLDVFISKLRKKLGPDSSVQLRNIHGMGYKLETAVRVYDANS